MFPVVSPSAGPSASKIASSLRHETPPLHYRRDPRPALLLLGNGASQLCAILEPCGKNVTGFTSVPMGSLWSLRATLWLAQSGAPVRPGIATSSGCASSSRLPCSSATTPSTTARNCRRCPQHWPMNSQPADVSRNRREGRNAEGLAGRNVSAGGKVFSFAPSAPFA